MSDRPTVRDVLAAWGILLNDRQAEQLLDEMKQAAREHGMVLVADGTWLVPTCLCGWISASERGAGKFGSAREAWKEHDDG